MSGLPSTSSVATTPTAPGHASTPAGGEVASGAAAPAPAPVASGAVTPPAWDYQKALDALLPGGKEPVLDADATLTGDVLNKYHAQQRQYTGYNSFRDEVAGLFRDGYKYELGGQQQLFKLGEPEMVMLTNALKEINGKSHFSGEQLMRLVYGPQLMRAAYDHGLLTGRATPSSPARVDVGTAKAPSEPATKVEPKVETAPDEDISSRGLFKKQFPERAQALGLNK